MRRSGSVGTEFELSPHENEKMEITRYFEPNFTGKYEKTFDEAAAEVEKVMKGGTARVDR